MDKSLIPILTAILLSKIWIVQSENTLRNYTVSVNDHVNLDCSKQSLSGDSSLFIDGFYWSFRPHNKRTSFLLCLKIESSYDCHISNETKKILPWLKNIMIKPGLLTLAQALPNHKGMFQCTYYNSEGIVEHYIKLDVQTPPGKPLISKSVTKLIENELVMLTCNSTTGNPRPQLHWVWRDIENKIVFKSNNINSTFDHLSQTFGWTSMTSSWIPQASDDTKSISCVAKNRMARVSSNSMYLSVDYKPVIYEFPSSPFYAMKNSQLSIECKAVSKSAITFAWYNSREEKIANGPYLIIRSVRYENKDTYKCLVSNTIGTSAAQLSIDVLDKPIIKLPSHISVNQNTSLIIRCITIPSSTNITWWWSGTNQLIEQNTDLIAQHGYNVDKYRDMLILPIPHIQSFQLDCKASVSFMGSLNSNGQPMSVWDKKTVNISVNYPPGKPKIYFYPKKKLLTGSDITLTCVPDKEEPGYPKPGYFWSKVGSNWMMNTTNFVTFSTIEFNDSGVYSCVVFNSVGKSEPELYELIIYGPPNLIQPQHSISIKSVPSNRPFELGCEFEGRPQPSMSWYLNEWPIEQFKTNSTLTNLPKFDITSQYQMISPMYVKMILTAKPKFPFTEYQFRNTTKFRCVGHNRYGKSYHVFKIRFLYSPKSINSNNIVGISHYGKDYRNRSAYLNCSILASPNVSFKWAKKLSNYNEQTITNGTGSHIYYNNNNYQVSEYQTIAESILIFTKFRSTDYGRYLCIANNSLDRLETEFEIRKISTPDPPNDLIMLTNTWTTLKLSWMAGFDGGCPQMFIVSYICQSQTRPNQIRVKQSKIILKNLLPGQSYKITISATNCMGTTSIPLINQFTTAAISSDEFKILSKQKSDQLHYELPTNFSSIIYCLTIDQTISKVDNPVSSMWNVIRSCLPDNVGYIKIDDVNDRRYRARICLRITPSLCSSELELLNSVLLSSFVTPEVMGTVAAICTALVILLAVMLFFILVRSKKIIPGMGDWKIIKSKTRKSSHFKKQNCSSSILPTKSTSATPSILYHAAPANHFSHSNLLSDTNESTSGIFPLWNTYSCGDQSTTPISNTLSNGNNPIEILNICSPHDLFPEGLYSTLVKSNDLAPFALNMAPITSLTRNIPLNDNTHCFCQNSNQFNSSIPISSSSSTSPTINGGDPSSSNKANDHDDKVFYEVMV